MDIEGKSILITGASRGIGQALARLAAQKSLSIHLVSRKPAESFEEELIALGAKSVRSWSLDLSDKEAIEDFIKVIKEQGVNIDILVNNAGQLTGGLIEDQPVDDIYQMLQVNLVGLIHLTRELLPEMLKLKEAKVVNNSSVSGMMFLPCASTYAASKAGVVAFTECIKQELRETSVSTLLLVTPGVETEMYRDIPSKYGKHLAVDLLKSIPAEKWAQTVFTAIEKDKDICWPKGSSRFGVGLGRHWPSLLERVVQSKFRR